MAPTGLIIASLVGAWFMYQIGYMIYNVYFHPLRKFPGPKLRAASQLIPFYHMLRGNMDIEMRKLHAQYGEVVRHKPDGVSFITAQAFKDVYGQYGSNSVPKDHHLYQNQDGEAADIVTAINDEDHSRLRRALAHAFSEKALREQEGYIKEYIDLLIEKLKGFAASGKAADLVAWYNFTTFDLIGDLAFGKSFGCLANNQYHSFVGFIFDSLPAFPWMVVMREYPVIQMMLPFIMPKSAKEGSNNVNKYSNSTLDARLQRGVNQERRDFFWYVLRGKDEKTKVSDEELKHTAKTLIFAGSETTATLLSGVTYWLCRTPDAMKKVTEEVRAAFQAEDEINVINATNRLPYLLACIDEGFRMYPPVPGGLPRRTKKGKTTMIDRWEVPGDTNVSVHQTAAYWSPLNFNRADEYHPERFQPGWDAPDSPWKDDNKAVINPFSLGPRNCVGKNLAYAEMRLVLARMLWNFDMELLPESKGWVYGQKAYGLWHKPTMNVKLSLRKRG
ncbi:cytochrome protein [Aulographum hederae CBS 113979]|uniref:Cytochrome protein n=1 Tax=Aulographum hederae CBS 113979 TaxID=1176131 RepID=A0A6G1HGS0_9PEZI|nr:cytochrome protein [Aulographum hederae CBS 113979]